MKQPNIIFIMTDQFRGDCLGITGHPDVKTPYLDTLASKGVLFDKAYSACPSCIAARAALHTGLSQKHHRRVGYQDGIPWRYEHTLAGELSKAGYYTQCVGKMHVDPLRNYLGFHNVELHDGYLHSARYGSVPYRQSQFVADDYFHWLKKEKGADADITDSGMECNSFLSRPFPYEEACHPTNWVTDRSIDFLRRRDPDMPFFLMASYVRPHPPFDAPEHYFNLYKDKALAPPAIGSWETDDLLLKKGHIFDSNTGPLDTELIRQAQLGYYACITHLDHQIGRLIQALIEHELYDDCIILFTSDHGEELCDHHYFRKSLPYEGSCHIPLFFSGALPEADSTDASPVYNRHCGQIVELQDIMPTLLELAGAPLPEGLDGKSLVSLLKQADTSGNSTAPVRPYLHGEHSYGEFSNHWIVTETDKYIWFSQTGKEQYFDLVQDKRECRNLISSPEKQERIAFLRDCLIRELSDRPEGFCKDGKLTAGRPYPPYIK